MAFNKTNKRKREEEEPSSSHGLKNINPGLSGLKVDYLYHLGLDTTMDLKAMFGDVSVVLMGGSPERSKALNLAVAKKLKYQVPVGLNFVTIGKKDRYSIFKCGKVLSVSHGIGKPSISILLNEITKLLMYSEAKDFIFLRVGTCGGLGLDPGSIVITTEALNPELQPFDRKYVLGKEVNWPTQLDVELTNSIYQFTKKKGHPVFLGKTMACSDFYEEQGRIDGYFCDYNSQDRLEFLLRCKKAGVINIEMESIAFASFCARAGIPASVLCVTLLNRMEGDQVVNTPQELKGYSDTAIGVAVDYVVHRLQDG
eukprot:Lithocolla_globosa_v1_NODE_3532_length_1646_cov_8.152106.p1 type:complete len:312 gc:universal NODE_3532_length_1646_cov_8.152106:532-1467(+)